MSSDSPVPPPGSTSQTQAPNDESANGSNNEQSPGPNGTSTGAEVSKVLGRRKRDDEESEGEDNDDDGPAARRHRANPYSMRTDPLVRHGRHFCRTVRALCDMNQLVLNGMAVDVEIALGRIVLDSMTTRQQRDYGSYKDLLKMIPKLEARLSSGSDEEVTYISNTLAKGARSARADDTKSMKVAIVDWIIDRNEALNPPLFRNTKADRGYNHIRTGQLLCPAGMDWSDPEVRESLRSGTTVLPAGEFWPLFVFEDLNYDPTQPWKGLFKGKTLVSAYKHVFTSPSSVENREGKATRSGNAQLNNMTQVTVPSLAYVATQVRFCLSSAHVFSKRDTVTESENFYQSVIRFLTDPEEEENVNALLAWWNQQIFPGSHVSNERNQNPCPVKIPLAVFKQVKQVRREAAALQPKNQNLPANGSTGAPTNPEPNKD